MRSPGDARGTPAGWVGGWVTGFVQVTADVSFDVSRLGHRETALLPGGLWVRQAHPKQRARERKETKGNGLFPEHLIAG